MGSSSDEVSTMASPGDRSGAKLRRELTLVDTISILAGMAIGSGIFATPGLILAQTGSVGEALLSWLGAGVVGLCLALLFAELGSCMPVSSGEAEFHRTAFGPAWSFAFVWSSFLIFFPGGTAVVTSTSARYFLAAIPSEELNGELWVKVLTILILVVFTISNCLGIRETSFTQNFLSLCKITLVVTLVAVAILSVCRDATILQNNVSKPFKNSLLKGFGPSLVFALWAFGGANNVAYLTEEMQNPARDVSRACLGTIFIMACTYLALNISYLCVLPSSSMKSAVTIAVDSTHVGLGQGAGIAVAILVGVSLLAVVNGDILCGGRYLFCAARDEHIHVRWLAQLSRGKNVPVAAMTLQCVWCIFVVILSTDVAKLLNYFSVGHYIFYCLVAMGHWRLRYTRPDLPRPYKMPFLPVPNVAVLCISSYVIVSTLFSDPFSATLSLVLVGSSFPVYVTFVRPRHKARSLENGDSFTPLLI